MSVAPAVLQMRVTVGGLDCADCAKTLERRISETPGVMACTVQFGAGRAQIEYAPDQVTSGVIAIRIRELGYSVSTGLADLDHVTFAVSGMDCLDCAKTLQASVAKLDGVRSAEVSFLTGQMRVQYGDRPVSPAVVVSAVERLGYRARLMQAESTPGRSRWFDRRTGEISLATVLAISGLIASRYGNGLWVAPALHLLAAVLAGYPVARAARISLHVRRADMNLLMTLAAIGAAALGDWAETSSLMILFAIGLQLQSATIERTRGAIRELMRLAPAVARVVRNGTIETIAIAEIEAGETVDVLPGERLPVDGVVIGGRSEVDQSAITGESMPRAIEPGSDVISGSVNIDGHLQIRTTSVGSDTTVARIIELVERAQASRAKVQTLVERFAAIYTPIVIVAAILLGAIGLVASSGDTTWIYRALILLVVACPCALVISTPVAIVSALGRASRMGVLFKGGQALESLATIRQIGFDKTGTLSHGRPEVVSVQAADGHDADDVLALAAAVERGSSHPIARGISRAAENLSVPHVRDVEVRPGMGIVGNLDGAIVQVGSRHMFNAGSESLLTLSGDDAAGFTEVYVGRNGQIEGVIRLFDSIRPVAPAVVDAIRKLGVRPFLLSGDNPAVANAIGAQAGINDVRANLLPADKARMIAEADKAGPVAMVGDGINDAPALALARVGIAMGAGGSAVAIEAADIALMSDDLTQIPRSISLARSTRQVILQNVVFALAAKAAFLGLTVGGYTSLWLAVLADVGASLLVTLNALRLLGERD